ncbi:molybdate ABC transporter substrate-binding protein [Jeotgalibacillus sp. S-D1]|uniref:molybdate ABC transporter substrate-binding protein n=1 Tax=Jeotgalibacillus sp. S-D1 TaxID=2552189 RepID=UPI001059D4BD|nr:molybdate ABC transporter substrate-binding protein [Jeotgalibacillus sp. S-D1]TDL31399.1 molybdate ABC transporter substrate-binding protein [Jeotgalibacillus sp. S-D1]
MSFFVKRSRGLLFLLLVLLTGCSPPQQDGTVISTAASLKESMEEIKVIYENEYPNQRLIFNYGGSGSLRRQIEQGAPADVFLSASKEHAQSLAKEDLIELHSDKVFLRNSLVVIGSKDHTYKSLEHMIREGGRIAIAIPETTPAGRYAKQALEHEGMWDEAEDRLVYGKDVSHVLTLVEQQNVAAGFVYQSDAIKSSRVKIIEQLDASLHDPIEYYAGIVKKSSTSREAEQFIQFLYRDDIQSIMEEHGFLKGERYPAGSG